MLVTAQVYGAVNLADAALVKLVHSRQVHQLTGYGLVIIVRALEIHLFISGLAFKSLEDYSPNVSQ
jgi:hypothetical protein